MAAQPPPVHESPPQRIYPELPVAEESSNEDEEDDHEEFSTTHPDPPPKLDTSRARSRDRSFNSTSSSFNTSSHQEASQSFPYGKVIAGLAVICLAYWLLSPATPPPGPIDRSEFGKVLGTVVKAYPAFSARDRDELKAAADRWFDTSTKDPVVVIIYAAGSSSGLLDALTTSTADFLGGKKTTVVTSTASTKRAHLHATFENTLKGGTKSTIGMREIEKLGWDAPLVLHSFADALHIAPSRPLIWLQVTRDDSLQGLSCDSAIQRTLTSSWIASGGNEDNVAPVISRVSQFAICLDWPVKTEL